MSTTIKQILVLLIIIALVLAFSFETLFLLPVAKSESFSMTLSAATNPFARILCLSFSQFCPSALANKTVTLPNNATISFQWRSNNTIAYLYIETVKYLYFVPFGNPGPMMSTLMGENSTSGSGQFPAIKGNLTFLFYAELNSTISLNFTQSWHSPIF